jgi:hypothetical protein
VPSSRIAAITKSNSVQFTSSVNCIAVNGISSKSNTVSPIPISLLFCLILNPLFLSSFSFFKKYYLSLAYNDVADNPPPITRKPNKTQMPMIKP